MDSSHPVAIQTIDSRARPTLVDEENVFLRAFTASYRSNHEILRQLEGDLEDFLRQAFSEERSDFENGKAESYFYRAVDPSKPDCILGFVSFDVDVASKSAYVRQLAVEPASRCCGIGRKLLFALHAQTSLEIDHMTLCVRRANVDAARFYSRLGFNESDAHHEGLSRETYMGLEWHLDSQILHLPIASPEIVDIPIKNEQEPLRSLFEPQNPRIAPALEIEGSMDPKHPHYPLVRARVHERVRGMLDSLPPYIGLAIFEGYRPFHVQKQYFDNKVADLVQSGQDSESARNEAARWVSPPWIKPVHCTGAAVDLTLFQIQEDGKRRLLDLGKFGVIFGPNPHPETLSAKVTALQRNNRRMLLRAATSVGLVNYGFEWWHYSYGDRAWAYIRKEVEAKYDVVRSL